MGYGIKLGGGGGVLSNGVILKDFNASGYPQTLVFSLKYPIPNMCFYFDGNYMPWFPILYRYLTNITITAPSIGSSAFKKYAQSVQSDKLKLKLKTSLIDSNAFSSFLSNSSTSASNNKIWISSKCATINSDAFYNFNSNAGAAIYCETASKPSGWNANWNYSNYAVYYGISEASFDAL